MNEITKTEGTALALPEHEMIQVLQSSLYPSAALASVKMVLSYCRAAGLDPLQKPVHIVPLWDSKAGQMRDVIMPGVNLYRIQASRSGQFAGMTEPEFGPDETVTLTGQSVTFPVWCRVTVRRLMSNGTVAEFTAREFWLENYATKGGKEKSLAPNAMWTKRPRGQIAKCASAQALRIAFPEIASQPTADEMEGKQLHADDGHDLAHDAGESGAKDLPNLMLALENCDTDAQALQLYRDSSAKLATSPRAQANFKAAVVAHRTALEAAAKVTEGEGA